jgi:hypothetical protein
VNHVGRSYLHGNHSCLHHSDLLPGDVLLDWVEPLLVTAAPVVDDRDQDC